VNKSGMAQEKGKCREQWKSIRNNRNGFPSIMRWEVKERDDVLWSFKP
jgi:hypothetical protein